MEYNFNFPNIQNFSSFFIKTKLRLRDKKCVLRDIIAVDSEDHTKRHTVCIFCRQIAVSIALNIKVCVIRIYRIIILPVVLYGCGNLVIAGGKEAEGV